MHPITQRSQITFTAPGEVAFASQPWTPRSESTLIRTVCSVISAGTELAVLRGTESWAPLPFLPGYGSVGEVISVASDFADCKPGDLVFTFGPHASIVHAAEMAIAIPEGLDPTVAAMARMASVSITARRVSRAELGDMVAVIGMGLVGNFAGQLMARSGCRVIGIDIDDSRLALAKQVGIHHTLRSDSDTRSAVLDLTHGRGCECVIDATGRPDIIPMACSLAGQNGEVILLGSPRGTMTAGALPMLNDVHLWRRNVTLRGAHEWVLPVHEDPSGRVKHSMQRNVRQLLEMLSDGSLNAKSLITHQVRPEEAAGIYRALADGAANMMGVVVNWA